MQNTERDPRVNIPELRGGSPKRNSRRWLSGLSYLRSLWKNNLTSLRPGEVDEEEGDGEESYQWGWCVALAEDENWQKEGR